MVREGICIVGTGKVAQALIRNLKDKLPLCITSPSNNRAKDIALKMGIKHVPYGKPLPCKKVIIVRKDMDIERTSMEIINFSPHTTEHIHMSGFHPSTILKSPKRCSIHPIISITPETSFNNVLFSVEGTIEIGLDIIKQLGGTYFVIDTDKKPIYHTALVFISNFTALNTLLGIQLLKEIANIPEDKWDNIIKLAYKSIDNVLKYRENGLTGPAARGDKLIVEMEASILDEPLKSLYKIQSDVIYKLCVGSERDEKDDSAKI